MGTQAEVCQSIFSNIRRYVVGSDLRICAIRCRRFNGVGNDATGPVMQPFQQHSTGSVSGVYDGGGWDSPGAVHVHAANQTLKGVEHGVYTGEEVRVLVFNGGHDGDARV